MLIPLVDALIDAASELVRGASSESDGQHSRDSFSDVEGGTAQVQKTLPMAMTVLSLFPPELGEGGLIAIPCILSHLTQLFADAFLLLRAAAVQLGADRSYVLRPLPDASPAELQPVGRGSKRRCRR